MATNEQVYERGARVVSFGVEAAKAVARMGMEGGDAMTFLAAGLVESVETKQNSGQALLRLLSIALMRIAELEETADV